MTFSITARCRRTGDLGVAVTTKFFAVGALCPAVRAGVGAVASQAVPNPALRAECLDRLANGARPEEALRQALATDTQAQRRQVGLIDAGGRTAAHTGAKCEDARGHVIESDCVVAGNTLVSEDVLRAVASSWSETSDGDLAERMLGALDAGQAAGGDRRGRQSAALLVGNANPLLALDLRVDDHSDPLVELRRLLGLYRERYEPVLRSLPAPGGE